jgi:cell fate (sporulation/competence/biofilm development) regulator YlbF (YheA/YmcA/DUF963 family)
MTRETVAEVELLFREWRQLQSDIERQDNVVRYLAKHIAEKPDSAVYFTVGGEVSADCLSHDLIAAAENYKRLMQAMVQEIENKIASKFKE